MGTIGFVARGLGFSREGDFVGPSLDLCMANRVSDSSLEVAQQRSYW
jgi:hypothetical protein